MLDNATSVCHCMKPRHHPAAPPPRAACAASPLLLTPRSRCNAGHRTNTPLTPWESLARSTTHGRRWLSLCFPSEATVFLLPMRRHQQARNHICSREEETPSNSSGLSPRFHLLLTSPKQCSLTKIRGKNDALRKEMFQHLL